MLQRFFAPSLGPDRLETTLSGDEARHLAVVLRLKKGAEIRVFDGEGREFRAEIVEIGRKTVRIRLVAPVEPAAESPVRLAVLQAVLKAESMDAVVRDLTMLGVAAIQPVLTGRTETTQGRLGRTHRSDRWRRIAQASAKQCGRAVLPAIGAPLELQNWLTADASDLRLVLVEPSGDSPRADPIHLLKAEAPPPRQVSLLSGPEGGWTRDEVVRIQAAGFVPWTLGPRTLRAETAPVVAVSVLQFVWGGLD